MWRSFSRPRIANRENVRGQPFNGDRNPGRSLPTGAFLGEREEKAKSTKLPMDVTKYRHFGTKNEDEREKLSKKPLGLPMERKQRKTGRTSRGNRSNKPFDGGEMVTIATFLFSRNTNLLKMPPRGPPFQKKTLKRWPRRLSRFRWRICLSLAEIDAIKSGFWVMDGRDNGHFGIPRDHWLE